MQVGGLVESIQVAREHQGASGREALAQEAWLGSYQEGTLDWIQGGMLDWGPLDSREEEGHLG